MDLGRVFFGFGIWIWDIICMGYIIIRRILDLGRGFRTCIFWIWDMDLGYNLHGIYDY